MMWHPVSSTWLHALRYEELTGSLQIRFLDGAVCEYDLVGWDLWQAFLAAPSKGTFVHQFIYKKIPWHPPTW